MKKEFDPQKHPWITSFITALWGVIIFLFFFVLPLLVELNPVVFLILTTLIAGAIIFRFMVF